MPSRIDAQLAFLTEADKLKSVLRATTLCDGSRPENTGEHSWHVALYALVMAEHAKRPLQIDRVIRMLLIHDLVEIDAGDVPVHSAKAQDTAAQAAKEQAAADRIFGLLPPDQAATFRALWDEFEAAETDDAIFAKSIDRVQPVISNLETGGRSWVDYNVTLTQLENRVGAKVSKGAPAIWSALSTRISAWFAQHVVK
jgi:putative hydrolase of HD superfamily